MYRKHVFALLLLVASFAAKSQQSAPVATQEVASTQTVLYAGPGVSAPRILPLDISISLPKHCNPVDGIAKLSAIVDGNGIPHDVQALSWDKELLKNFAVQFIASQRFKAGTYNGAAATVAIELTVGLHLCAAKTSRNERSDDLTLRARPIIAMDIAQPPFSSTTAVTTTAPAKSPDPSSVTAPNNAASVYQIGGPISSPVPIVLPESPFPDSAIQSIKRAKVPGVCVLGVVINEKGIPQNVHKLKSTDDVLCPGTIETIKTWRFKPALKDGNTPVPVEAVVVNIFWHIEDSYIANANLLPISQNDALALSITDIKFNQPTPLNQDEVMAERVPARLTHRVKGLFIAAALIGTDGIPGNLHVIKGLDPAVDEDLIQTIAKLRFKPAMKDKATPYPYNVLLPIRFRTKIIWRLF